ncbi:MAG: hypothetical protein ACETV0_05130 [Nitrososphaeria archaeon]
MVDKILSPYFTDFQSTTLKNPSRNLPRMYSGKNSPYPLSLSVALVAMNAASYAVVGVFIFYFVPLYVGGGIVRFWPQVFVPGVFAVVFGPTVGGLGAAIGIFINDMFIHGDALLSLIVGVPANFIMFYLIGFFTKRKLTTFRYLAGGIVGNAAGCLWIGMTLWAFTQYIAAVGTMGPGASATVGLFVAATTFLAQIPFVVLAVPPVVYAIARVYPDMMVQSRVSR